MKLINPSYEILEQKPGLDGIYEMIEIAGRNCYKSTHKEGTTAKDFVDRMIASKHLGVLEHGTVYLTFYNIKNETPYFFVKYIDNPYSYVHYENGVYYITSNYRVLYENGWLKDLEYLCEPTEYHEKRVTVKFTSSIHFYKDITRHKNVCVA